VLSVVHTGVTLVSSDISSGFASSKRKVFVEQTVCTHFFFHSRTLHLDIIKVFTPTDAHVFFKRSIKIYIKTDRFRTVQQAYTSKDPIVHAATLPD